MLSHSGFGNDGVWLPTGLNECIKMIRFLLLNAWFLMMAKM